MRIVSLVPSHTETLFDLGCGKQVVGRTRFCIFPEAAAIVPAVGGTKDASLEKILALHPDLVVADKDENPKALVEALTSEGIEVMWSEIDTVPDAAAFIVRLGDAVGAEDAARDAAADIDDALAEVRGDGPEVPAFVPIWYDPWMTFDATAYPDAMLQAVGIRNVFRDHQGPKYFEVAASDVAGSDAQFALLPTEPYPFHKRRDAIELAPLGACAEAGRVHILDGEALTWFGTRTARGLRELARTRDALPTVSQ